MVGKLKIQSGDKARIGGEGLIKNRSCFCSPWTRIFLSITVFLWGGLAFGHHGGAEWDTKAMTTVQGTITEFRFVNPHVQIYFDSKDNNGKVVHWSCDAPDPAMLVRQGWTRETLKAGDQVTLVGHPAKSGAKMITLQKVTLPGGQELEARGAAQ
jgi:Family of unknown function (DUF6152)